MLNQSIYEREKQAKAQGFAYAVKLQNPQWEQFGYVLNATLEQAIEEGKGINQRCDGFEVYRVALSSPFTSELVYSGKAVQQ
jgi:hypothetical protein